MTGIKDFYPNFNSFKKGRQCKQCIVAARSPAENDTFAKPVDTLT